MLMAGISQDLGLRCWSGREALSKSAPLPLTSGQANAMAELSIIIAGDLRGEPFVGPGLKMALPES